MKKACLTLFFVLPFVTLAQELDSVKIAPIRPAFYLDYGKAAGSAIPNNQKWEGGFELMFYDRIQTIIEIGKWDLSPESAIENGSYRVEGSYMRYGIGYTPYVDPTSRIGIGFRYATSLYSDEGYYTIISSSELQPDIEETFKRTNLSATWMEAVVYSDKSVNKWLTIGFNFRLRFMQSYDASDSPAVMTVPGYGRALDKTVPAFNLFLKIEPF